MKKITTYVMAGLGLMLIVGCANNRHMVLASTGTNIGVEISQNPASQVPQAKLGYQRAELAIVPSNRSTKEDSEAGGGANEVADVLMEMRYRGIFSWGANSGIYQRLAVGKTAVSQPGAALLFAKADDGSIAPGVAAAIQDLAGQKNDKQKNAAETVTEYVFGAGQLDPAKLTGLLMKANELNENTITDSVMEDLYQEADGGRDGFLDELNEYPFNVTQALQAGLLLLKDN
jgi:hypothetical protein